MDLKFYSEKEVENIIRKFLGDNNFKVEIRGKITGSDILAQKDGINYVFECKGNLRKDGK